MAQPPNLLNIHEAGAMVRKTPAQMRWMRHNGTGPRSALLGGRVVYIEQDVLDWIEAAFAAEDAKRATA